MSVKSRSTYTLRFLSYIGPLMLHYRRFISKGLAIIIKQRVTLAIVGAMSSVASISSVSVQSSEMIPRELLVDMARSQYAVLCGSNVFKRCMGFTDTACSDLSATAIEQCLLTLPEEISPLELENSALESCPTQVFENAGYSEANAKLCFDEAMAAEG